MITHAELLELVKYDPETGSFVLLMPSQRQPAGTKINRNRFWYGSRRRVRHCEVYVPRHRNYRAGRLAWFYMTGEWPPADVDHRDNDGWNQRWANLRLATRSQNQANTRRYKSNSSGLKCVFPSGGKKRPWRAQIQKDNRRISLGRFSTREEAFAAYVKAAEVHHGEYARFS